jgi:saccharopine dehydrogenase-like NADP-dependent oxidoreductase
LKTVLLLGGYGGFGSRLARRLSGDGWRVLIAGRDASAAERLAATLPGASGFAADRTADLAPLLELHRPDLVIDAAGPFQQSDYRVPRTCIACGIDYLDLADARDFVCGITSLDEAARKAGVRVVSGASSVPGLSGAVIRALTRDMQDVRSVRMAISASNRATAGVSVSSAILASAGQPLRLWRGRRWCEAFGWREVTRERFCVAGREPMTRLVALCDVPDHELVPEEVRGRPATRFDAGPELAVQLLALRGLGLMVRWGVLKSAVPFARWLLPLQRLTKEFGSDRSAMSVEVKGLAHGEAVARRWVLLAEEGDGPEIPTLAAQLLAASCLSEDRPPAGAMTAASLLSLEDFDPLFRFLAVFQARDERPATPLYRRIMGPRFDALPLALRALHEVIGDGGAAGTATVSRGRSHAARLVCALMGFPPSGVHPLHVAFEEHDGVERWTRDFGGHVFSSRLSQSGRQVVERFGPLQFHFDLETTDNGLEMHLREWCFLGIALPLLLAPRSTAREWADGDDYRFDVSIGLPLVGRVVHYAGRLRRI